eukprot:5951041-Amphidinium_carterae.1
MASLLSNSAQSCAALVLTFMPLKKLPKASSWCFTMALAVLSCLKACHHCSAEPMRDLISRSEN